MGLFYLKVDLSYLTHYKTQLLDMEEGKEVLKKKGGVGAWYFCTLPCYKPKFFEKLHFFTHAFSLILGIT